MLVMAYVWLHDRHAVSCTNWNRYLRFLLNDARIRAFIAKEQPIALSPLLQRFKLVLETILKTRRLLAPLDVLAIWSPVEENG